MFRTVVLHIEFANDSLNTFANHLPNENSSLGDVHNNKFSEESNAIIFNYGQAANQIEMFCPGGDPRQFVYFVNSAERDFTCINVFWETSRLHGHCFA